MRHVYAMVFAMAFVMALATIAHAGQISAKVTKMKYLHSFNDGSFIGVVVAGEKFNCTNSVGETEFRVNTSNPLYKTYVAILLTAYTTKQPVTIYADNQPSVCPISGVAMSQ